MRRKALIVVAGATIATVVAAISLVALFGVRQKARERDALAAMKAIAIAEVSFKTSDRDRNERNDYWTGDVSGLYRITTGGPNGDPIRLIDLSIAIADGFRMQNRPKDERFEFNHAALSNENTAASNGYYFQMLEAYELPSNARGKYDDGTGHHINRFAVLAYPATYGNETNTVFFLNEQGVIYRRDPGGNGFVVGAPPRCRLGVWRGWDYSVWPLAFDSADKAE